MVKLHLIAEVHDAKNAEEARVKLDAFRESVLPSENHGITIVEDSGSAHALLVLAAQSVIDAWSVGDLAAAVRTLAKVIAETKKGG